MEIYLVGGAVRDQLLGLPVSERDWVVVGATPEEMLRRGFQPVGKDFPVFLHPQTHEEYALARTERKTGKGYKGFAFYSAPDVSLIADLHRRDLTINAIAQTPDGQLIDPYNGQSDLKNRILRHVSEAFQEDPVRILRLARFAARFTDFTIHPSTYELMQRMVEKGEVNALVPERVWQEFCRALESTQPWRFLEVLQQCGALAILFPEIQLSSITLSAFKNACIRFSAGTIRFAALLHELPPPLILAFCQRYRIPREYIDLAILTAHWQESYRQILLTVSASQAEAQAVFDLLKAVDARRRPERFQNFLRACQACVSSSSADAGDFLQSCLNVMLNVNILRLTAQDLKGSEFAQQLEKLQLEAIQQHLMRFNNSKHQN